VTDTLLIHYNPAQVDTATWSLVNDNGELTAPLSHTSLEDIAATAAQHRTVVLLNNTLIHINQVQLPTQQRQKLLRAIPYALEEQIADDVDAFHFVAGKPDASNHTAVAGIHRAQLQAVLDTLAAHNIRVQAVLPDALCLTADAQQWAIMVYEDTADIQLSRYQGNEYDRDMVALIIAAALKNKADAPPQKIIVFRREQDSVADIEALIPPGVECITVQYNQHPLVVYCGHYKNAMALNLLQGEFKPGRETSEHWHRWRLAASLAALWLVINLITTGIEYKQLANANIAASAEIENLYKTAFPESSRIVNPRVQMEQKLSELRSGIGGTNSMLALLRQSAIALTQDKSIKLQSIDFRNERLDINLTSNTLSAIQQLNTSLSNSGALKSEITSSTSDKNEVKGSLRIQKSNS
jgi:general secretion pathway protein L